MQGLRNIPPEHSPENQLRIMGYGVRINTDEAGVK
jgi:hypothetical protein